MWMILLKAPALFRQKTSTTITGAFRVVMFSRPLLETRTRNAYLEKERETEIKRGKKKERKREREEDIKSVTKEREKFFPLPLVYKALPAMLYPFGTKIIVCGKAV